MNSGGLDGLRPDEMRAARAVARAVGVEPTANDVGGKQRAFDVLLTYPDGRTAALEVSSHAAWGRRQLSSELNRMGHRLPNPGSWSWTVSLSDPRDLPGLRHYYEVLIAACEEFGVVDPRLLPPALGGEASAWLAGCRGHVQFTGNPHLPAAEAGHRRPVYVLEASVVTLVDEALVGLDAAVVDLLQVPAIVSRNAKVVQASTDEHHLFVTLDLTGLPSAVSAAFWGASGGLPGTSELVLPAGLSHLWLAPEGLQGMVGFTQSEGWMFHRR